MFGESMTEVDIEIILERAKELHQAVRPRVISDDGPQFIAKDFKEFIRVSGVTHVSTSPVRPNSAIGYITPKDLLAERQPDIHADRDRKLEAARQQPQIRRQSAA